MRKLISIFIIIILICSLTACESSTAKQALEQAKLAMAEGDYTKSLNMYQLALDEGSKDGTIADNISVLSAYQTAMEAFTHDQMAEAKTALDNLTVDYESLSIKDDMDKLKKFIEERVTEIEKNNTLLQELQALFDQQSYDAVVDKATQMLTWNLTEEQKTSASGLLEQSNQKLREVAEAEKKANEQITASRAIALIRLHFSYIGETTPSHIELEDEDEEWYRFWCYDVIFYPDEGSHTATWGHIGVNKKSGRLYDEVLLQYMN